MEKCPWGESLFAGENSSYIVMESAFRGSEYPKKGEPAFETLTSLIDAATKEAPQCTVNVPPPMG